MNETPLPQIGKDASRPAEPLSEWRQVYAMDVDGLLFASVHPANPLQLDARNEIKRRLAMIDPLLNHEHDDSGECSKCGAIVCPFGESLHFHHDGCPACHFARLDFMEFGRKRNPTLCVCDEPEWYPNLSGYECGKCGRRLDEPCPADLRSYKCYDIETLREALDAATDIGIYPKSVIGGKNPYEKRTDFMEGWNAALIEVQRRICKKLDVPPLQSSLATKPLAGNSPPKANSVASNNPPA